MRFSVVIKLEAGDRELRLRRLVRMGSQLSIKSEGADGWSVLIASPVRNERFVRYFQREFTLAARLSHVKRVFAHLRLRLKAEVLNDRAAAHLAP